MEYEYIMCSFCEQTWEVCVDDEPLPSVIKCPYCKNVNQLGDYNEKCKDK